MLTAGNLLRLLLLAMRTGLLRVIAILEFSVEIPSQDKRHNFRDGPWVSKNILRKVISRGAGILYVDSQMTAND